ncbi:ParB/RepB/Spo0J family partition protein [Amaricoccus solimangrovi]|uniref:ParB/RepB/Spo0J family partition protein n=1 Tax=Amaricoccus solimangrovi TaxID=2589815 RepID=A0A501WHH3_9RHOB|nr:ParB/RepB/Spo0J family partition protein [Amaricoccus solimangrovi]TPE47885.1 ParB/RepB/Spo0J family partition protein [Amaricoccus solimangrovi]
MALDQNPTAAILATVPVARLYVHPFNPRSEIDEAGIVTLAENIRALGLIQNLAGIQDDDGRIGIVAGGRRLRALERLGDDPRFAAVPVRIAPDLATARLWAASENHLRVALHPADEIREYAALAGRGVVAAEIAIAFGVTDAHVRRRLKLAGLPAPVLAALRADEISLGAAACFTLCDDLDHALGVLEQARGRGFDAQRLRRLLKPAAIRDTDRRARFVGLEAYQQAGGRITRDLFEGEVYCDDPEILDACFAEKLTEAAEARRAAEGWKWVRTFEEPYLPYEESRALGAARLYPVPGELSPEQTERYAALAERAEAEDLDADEAAELDWLGALLDGGFTAEQVALAGIVVYVGHDGALRTEAGLVRAEDRAEAEAAGLLAPSRHADDARTKSKSPLSAALAEDLARGARGARQQAALRDPDLILDLLAFELSGRIGAAQAFGLRRDIVPNQPGTATGFALDARLTEAAPAPENPWDFDRAEAFRAFRETGAEHTRAELLRHLAGLLAVSDEKLGALIDAEAGTDIRAVWTPTAENFLGRVSGAYLDALWRELLDLAPEAPAATAFAKLRKGEKAARLESLFADPETRAALGLGGEQEARVAAWLPPEAF